LTEEKQSFMSDFRSVRQDGGLRCIGCAVSEAHEEFIVNGRSDATKVMIVIVGGRNINPAKYSPVRILIS
jgi:hypothetical protein